MTQRLGSFNADVITAIQNALGSGSPSFASGGPILTPNTVLCSGDVSGYLTVSVALIGNWINSVSFAFSNDNTNWFSATCWNDNLSTVPGHSAESPGLYIIPIKGRYFQIVTSPGFFADSQTAGSGVSWTVYLLLNNFNFTDTVNILADPATPLPMGGTNPDGRLEIFNTDPSGTLYTIAPGTGPAAVDNGGPIYGPNIICAQFDCTGYENVSVQLSGNWRGGLIANFSNDGLNWNPIRVCQNSNGDVLPTEEMYLPGLYVIPIIGRYFQIITDPDFTADLNTPGNGVSFNIYLLVGDPDIVNTINVLSDPANPLIIGGVTPTGNPSRILTDAAGNLRPSDIPNIIQNSASALNAVLFEADTTGFNSISIQLNGTFVATITFQIANDGINWVSAIGYQLTTANAVSNAVGVGIYVFQTQGKYFRAFISAYTSGTVICTAALRAAAGPSSVSQNSNIALISGSSLASTNVVGMFAVGGNIAAGSAPTAYPVLIAGVDTGGLTRRLLTDPLGNVAVGGNVAPAVAATANPIPLGGVDAGNITRRLAVDIAGAIATAIKDNGATLSNPGILETLNAMFMELRELNLFIRQLPLYLNLGLPMIDEPTSLNDPTNLQ